LDKIENNLNAFLDAIKLESIYDKALLENSDDAVIKKQNLDA
jgi:hypothetical protein